MFFRFSGKIKREHWAEIGGNYTIRLSYVYKMLEKPLIANVLLRILEIDDLAAQKELRSSIFLPETRKRLWTQQSVT